MGRGACVRELSLIGGYKPAWLRYFVAIVSVVVATLGQLLIGLTSNQVAFLLYFAAISFAAWYGGLGPGLLATALSALAAILFFLPPYGTLAITDPGTVLRLVLFV